LLQICCSVKKTKNKKIEIPTVLDGPLKITNHVTLLQKKYHYQIFKNNKKKRFFFLAEKMKEYPVGKTKTNIDEKKVSESIFC